MRSAKPTRLRFLAVVIFLVACVLISRLYYLQIMKGTNYAEIAERQYTKPYDQIFDRGIIYFKDKNGNPFISAGIKTVYTLAINPKILKNDEQVYEKISKIISIDKNIFLEKSGKKTDPYEEIANKIDESKAKQITALKIEGVTLYKDKMRYYPGDNLASQVIGLLGYNGSNELAGRYGLERQYENTLIRNPQSLYSNFFSEVFSGINTSLSGTENLEGDIYVSIEPTVQKNLEDKLESVNKKYDSEITGGVIIDPKTGEIYAMGVYPDFNINSFKNEDSKVFSNPIVEGVYEMGSIVKPLSMAAGIDAGVVTDKTTYNDKGFVETDGMTIWNHDKKGHGVISMQEVLNQSLNTGVSFVVSKMGTENFAKYMKAYGLGEKTGIDLPNETSGLIKNLSSNRNVEFFTASFGQGIAISPIETVRALSSLANGGYLISPHLVTEIKHTIGLTESPKFSDSVQILKASTSNLITKMLVNVVDKALLGGIYKNPHYSVAAKTGTAQMVNSSTKSYYSDRYLHSFFGYFPAYNPKFLIFLYTVYPKGVDFASHTLTEPFMDLTKFLIHYYRIQPDR